VAGAVVVLLGFGAHASEGLTQGLAGPSQHVRHACALGLGQLKLPRSLPALLQQIEQEPTPSWTEMARALGDFGKLALTPVAEALKRTERRERLMLGLVHLANHGCVEDVKSLESDPDPGVALAARQALVRKARMEAEDLAVRNAQPLRDNSPEARFSQAFFAEVARVAH
jgi:HEAT repeat protein